MFTATYLQNLIFVVLTTIFTYALNTSQTSVVTPLAPRKFAPPSVELTHRLVEAACVKTEEKQRSLLVAAVQEASLEFEIEPHILLAVMFRESSCRMGATSGRGAMGLMQIMPKTARSLGLQKPYILRQNVLAGAKYLSLLLKQFDGDLYLALAAYNAGPGSVRKYGKVPPYVETQNYVRAVLEHYQLLTSQFTV